jgi:hypothetical protein
MTQQHAIWQSTAMDKETFDPINIAGRPERLVDAALRLRAIPERTAKGKLHFKRSLPRR